MAELVGMTLDLSDPFEAAVAEMVETNRKKRSDYAQDGEIFSNFYFTSSLFGMRPEEAAIINVAQKLARLGALRSNGRPPQNESVADTYLDLAVYAVIALAIYRETTGRE